MATTKTAAAPKGVAAPSSSSGNLIENQRKKLLIPLVGPAFLFYTILFIAPSIGALWISLFSRWDAPEEREFVGAGNYVQIINDSQFQQSFINTLKLLFIVGIVIFVLAFAMSLVLRNMWGKTTVRSVIFFPHLVNALVFGVLAGFILNPNGLMNQLLMPLLRPLGFTKPIPWLDTSNMFTTIMVLIIITQTGYYTTILMAGVDRIPNDYFEVAALTGCNAFQRLRYIILPLTWDVFGTCAVLWTITSVKLFEMIWLFGGSSGNGVPPNEVWTVAVYTYVTGFAPPSGSPDYGKGAASAIVSLLLIFILVVLLRRVMRRDSIQF